MSQKKIVPTFLSNIVRRQTPDRLMFLTLFVTHQFIFSAHFPVYPQGHLVMALSILLLGRLLAFIYCVELSPCINLHSGVSDVRLTWTVLDGGGISISQGGSLTTDWTVLLS